MNSVTQILNRYRQWDLALVYRSWPVLIGLAFLYVPTYYMLATTIWRGDDNAHGPLVLGVVLWLFWKNRHLFYTLREHTHPFAGTMLFTVGLMMYIVGRSQQILIFEIGSQIPLIAGLLLIFRGIQSLRGLWFPLFFMTFMLPLPEFVVETLTGPLKQYISIIVENVLHIVGYPIARSGVILSIGPYQLLVADACSGLNSMFSLSALGLLYLYVARRKSWWRNGVIISAIYPIAFFANVVRVMTLVLITYYFGDQAGQGFLHGFAGMLLFMTALFLMMVLDRALDLTTQNGRSQEAIR